MNRRRTSGRTSMRRRSFGALGAGLVVTLALTGVTVPQAAASTTPVVLGAAPVGPIGPVAPTVLIPVVVEADPAAEVVETSTDIVTRRIVLVAPEENLNPNGTSNCVLQVTGGEDGRSTSTSRTRRASNRSGVSRSGPPAIVTLAPKRP